MVKKSREKQLEDAYTELWCAVEDGRIKEKFFGLRAKFRRLTKWKVVDISKKPVKRKERRERCEQCGDFLDRCGGHIHDQGYGL